VGDLEDYWLPTSCDVQAWGTERAAARAKQTFVPTTQKIKNKTTFSSEEAGKPQRGRKLEWKREEGHSCRIVRFVKKKWLEMLILFFSE